jgi:hypothetical protein
MQLNRFYCLNFFFEKRRSKRRRKRRRKRKTGYVEIASRRGEGRGKLVTSKLLHAW